MNSNTPYQHLNEIHFTEISDFSLPGLDLYANLSETQLLHYYEPNGGLFMAESPMIIERALRAGYEPVSLLIDKKEVAKREELLALCSGVPVYIADFAKLSQQTVFHFQMTRGALCAMRRRPLPTVEDVCKGARRICILENVVNPTNVGAIFRSAAALGIDAILLTPASSDPLYRRSIRVSMASVFQIPWTYFDNEDASRHVNAKTDRTDALPVSGHSSGGSDDEKNKKENKVSECYRWPQPAIEKLHQMGFKTVAMALKEDSVGLEDPDLLAEEKLAIIMGTEGDGLADSTIEGCDYTVMIPMAHGIDSLNVAAASAVAFWQLRVRE